MKHRILLIISAILFLAQTAQAQRYDDKRYRDDRRYDRKHDTRYDDRRYDDRRYDDRRDRKRHDRRDDRIYAMDDREFNNAYHAIKDASFSSTKLEIARSVLSMNWMTAHQINRIIQQFSFESDKLTFAKEAFYRCVDQNNYYMIMNSFSFSSSKEEISRMMSGY